MFKADITPGLVIRFSTIALFVTLSIASLIFSAYMFIEVNSTYTFVLACVFLGIALFAGFFNVYASISYFRSYYYDKYINELSKSLKPLRSFPTVAVMMPVYNEDVAEVKKNMLRLRDIDYPKDRIRYYVVDDSTDAKTKAKLEAFCKSNRIAFVHRDDRTGYKAGALNRALKSSKEEFIAIFDADEYLTDVNFLKDLLPYFHDENLAYVQTEKRFAKGTFFSNTVDLFDAFFFKFIQPHRALNNTAIFAGSCGVIRKSAFEKIGGFPEYVIEDTFFSLESDLHNFKSLYIPHVYALGRPIVTYTGLVKQQWRYNYGDTQFIKYFIKRNAKTSSKTRWSSLWAPMDYWSHGFGLNYLSIVLIAFTIMSVFVSFSTIPFVHMTITQIFQASYISRYLEIFGGAAFVLSMIAPAILTKIYFGSASEGLMIFVLNFALAISRAKAALAAISKRSSAWKPIRVNKSSRGNIRYAIANTKTEIVVAASLLSLGFVAFISSNIAGWIWLSTYGILYLFATVLLYKYG